MPVETVISVRQSTGTYVARIKGFKPTASNTISAYEAAKAIARKFYAESNVVWILENGKSPNTFSIRSSN
ncbi:hypothetical protein [Pseudomonas sp. Root562]|uniref:hypothetical protein n=1 Tax=Pseudomonas sp. Root562 TaxID=1736561 RepID=UPI000702B747|nr:hypothetical protein [Pseudomonas sp. Root562]KQZ94542.1 hypothetical protein ASD60_00650 [Pseudomonas sp. Root562]